MELFYGLCHEAHMDVLRALELGLGTPKQPFDIRGLCMPNMSELRLNYYPPIDIQDLKSGRINRISEHTDFGTVTLLFQDSVGGLEIEDQAKPYHYVPIECDSKSVMLVNIGDSLQRLTNDYLTSVSHRVTIPVSNQEAEEGTIAERRSIAYFAKVHRDNSLKPLKRFVTEDVPAKYPDVSAYEWNQIKLERIYGVC
jgi:isopenicillin N synthase-like dioxygenase